MNTYESTTAASGPTVGLIELPELAELLSACGLQVVTGPDFRTAATAIRDAFKVAGEFPIITADVNAPALRPWLSSIRQVTSVPVGIVRGTGAPALEVDGAVELNGPFTVDAMLQALGVRAIGGPGGGVYYPYSPAAPAAPAAAAVAEDPFGDPAPVRRRDQRAAPVAEDPFGAPAAQSPSPAPSSRRAARESAPVAPEQAAPEQEAPVSRRARRAQETEAPGQAADAWDDSPSYQGAPAPRQAPPSLSVEEETGLGQFQQPVAPVYAEPAPQQWEQPAQQGWEQPAQPVAPVYAEPAPQQWEQPAQQGWEQPQQPAAPVYAEPAQQQWEQPAQPVAPVYAEPAQQQWEQPAQPVAPVYAEPAPQQWEQPAQQGWEQPQPVAPVYAEPAPQQWEQPAQQGWEQPQQPVAPVYAEPAPQQWEQPQFQQPAAPAQPSAQEWDAPPAQFQAAADDQWGAPPAGRAPQQDSAAAFFTQQSPSAPAHHGLQGALGVTGKPDAAAIFDAYEASKVAGTGRSAAGLGSFVINYSGKGGVGKSTTSLQLAKVASDAGMSVILIDGNSGQGDLRTYLRLNRTDLPTIYDAAIGPVKNAVLTPKIINENREENLGEVKFAFVAAPPDDINDPDVITHEVYRRVIEFARRSADLVIMDTQIIESADRTGVVTQLILPALVHDAWGVGIADMTNVGVNNLNNRLRKFVREGVPVDRLMVMINKVHPEQVEMASKAVNYFTGRATFLGSIEMDAGIHQDMNAGRIGIENKQMHSIMSQILFRVTGNEEFERGAQAPAPAAKGRGVKAKPVKQGKAPAGAQGTKPSFMDVIARFIPGKKGE